MTTYVVLIRNNNFVLRAYGIDPPDRKIECSPTPRSIPVRTRTDLSTEIFDWREVFYNRTRRHSALGMLAPIAYEKLHAYNTSAA